MVLLLSVLFFEVILYGRYGSLSFLCRDKMFVVQVRCIQEVEGFAQFQNFAKTIT